MQMWIVGQYVKETAAGAVWEFQGVFDSREKAVEACAEPSYFIGPIDLNTTLPHDGQPWPGCEYPNK